MQLPILGCTFPHAVQSSCPEQGSAQPIIRALMISAQQCHPPSSTHLCAQLCTHLCSPVPTTCA
ncbi:unnamed protein product [Staurois parvus]|uniref:Uncharacterized protein n=1 Tax=Staurois parvus TaxID=386267 RepID=A0ABN9GNE6_9NEOB|nr:unnamed protein product [Staurois parvus]